MGDWRVPAEHDSQANEDWGAYPDNGGPYGGIRRSPQQGKIRLREFFGLDTAGANGRPLFRPFSDLEKLKKPEYPGSFGLERAWKLAPDIAGKSLDEIKEFLQTKFDGLREEIRSDIAKNHGGRLGRIAVLGTALWNALDVINLKANEWVKSAKDTDSCADLIYLARDVHDQVFLIDELISMGCWSCDGQHRTNGDEDILAAINGIKDLIDWDECQALKRYVDAAESIAKSKADDDLEF